MNERSDQARIAPAEQRASAYNKAAGQCARAFIGPSSVRGMQAAQQNELEAMTDMFNKMTEQCFRKCVALYKEADLSVGEATCVDRCVHKYMTSHAKVQEILAKQAASVQAQQQMMGNVPR